MKELVVHLKDRHRLNLCWLFECLFIVLWSKRIEIFCFNFWIDPFEWRIMIDWRLLKSQISKELFCLRWSSMQHRFLFQLHLEDFSRQVLVNVLRNKRKTSIWFYDKKVKLVLVVLISLQNRLMKRKTFSKDRFLLKKSKWNEEKMTNERQKKSKK